MSGLGISRTGWVGSASSNGTSANKIGTDSPANAFDGDITTRWSNGKPQSSADWFKLDLGRLSSVSQVILYLGNDSGTPNLTDFAVSYELSLSMDDVTYVSVAMGSGSAPATPICFPAQCARYIKIADTGTTTTSWWSIYELAVVP